MQSQTKKTAFLGLFLALALILSYVESMLPIYFGIPGAKIGLANLLIVLTLYAYGWREALLINGMRIVLSGFLFGNMFGILYSLAGALVSFAAMLLARKSKWFSIVGVSVWGGVFHNVGQLLVAMCILAGVHMLSYLPVLLISGLLTGLVNGKLAELMYKRYVLLGAK